MNRRLRVCHVSTLTRRGGVETMLTGFLRNSSSERCKHFFLATSATESLLDELQGDRVPAFQPVKFARYDPSTFFQMATWLKHMQIDIIHSYNHRPNCWTSIAGLHRHSPVHIMGEHGTVWQTNPPMLWLEKVASMRACCIVANSKASKAMLCHRLNIPKERIRVIYNGVSSPPPTDKKRVEQLRKKLGIQNDELIVGTVARLTPEKDIWTLLRAAAYMVHEQYKARFVIVGGGPLETELREFACNLGIANHVFFAGWQHDVYSFLHLFDIFVLTSIVETFGNSIIEAAMAGVPAIGPAVDGVVEAIVNGQTGLLVKPTLDIRRQTELSQFKTPDLSIICGAPTKPKSLDPYLLAEAISELAESPENRKKYGHAARRRSQREFSMQTYCRNIEDFYCDIFDKKSQQIFASRSQAPSANFSA